jgi:hypothetical protein
MAQERDQYEVGIQQVLKILDENQQDAKELRERIVDACDRVMAHHADRLVAYYLDSQKASTRNDHDRGEIQRALRMKEAVEKWKRPREPEDDKPFAMGKRRMWSAKSLPLARAPVGTSGREIGECNGRDYPQGASRLRRAARR